MDPKLAEQLKKKEQQNQPPQPSQQELSDLKAKYAVLEAQTKLLQEQLLLKKSDDEELKAQQVAEKLAKEQAALESEADLRKTLSQAFPPQATKSDDDEGAELKPSQMIGVMADAFGKASDAQSKLLLSKVGEMMKRVTGDLDSKISGTQQALIKLVAGLSVDQAKSQFKDFDEFAPDIREILSKSQGLSPEDAYLLAKARKASKTPSQQEVETERPSESMLPSSRRETTSEIEEPAGGEGDHQMSAKAAFKDAVSKAIDKQLAARGKRK